MSYCTLHSSDICTLCCTLERSCHDTCKKQESNGEAPPVYMLGGEINRKQ
ncbi:MAG: hypothetical protein LC740_12465 [Actinobacteria bacterium]|jgi:hypothetical protein|nr:hypothetical protein [Actinomycetota bacterium]